jgi:2,3-bisphosphoglycerate-independent phosphoglycerate mutase
VGEKDSARNPIAAAPLPVLDAMLRGRGPMLGDEPAEGVHFRAIDARLGVEGLPQSGTGQTTLLTGVNAAKRIGRHFGPWVHTQLRDLLAAENLLSRARRSGRLAVFANAYPSAYVTDTSGRALRRPAAPPFAARAAGVLVRDERDLRAGRAVASEIDHAAWRDRLDPTLPPITPRQAGRVLAAVAASADVTLFAHYATDTVGHRGDYAAAVAALVRVDEFLGGLLEALPDDALLVITSDHGNIEDVDAAHTLNPVPLIASGPGAALLVRRTESIADVTPALLHLLRIE